MKMQQLLPLLLAAAIPAACADNVSSFSDADTDKDGNLSVAEAKVALPDVQIQDTNEDGVVSRAEAARAIEGFVLANSNSEQANAPVKESDYQMIVEALAKSMPKQSVTSNN